jgi:hypothetical protein
VINSLFSAFEGVNYAVSSIELKRMEDSIRAGGNNFDTALLQLGQGFRALDFVDKAYQTAGLPQCSWANRYVICLTPILLATLKASRLVPGNIKPALTFFQNHLGDLYQIATVVSSVALFVFGQHFFAVSSLSVLGLGLMDRNGWLPLPFREALHQYTVPLSIATGLISGGVVSRIFGLFGLVLWYANTPVSCKNNSGSDFAVQQKLTPQIVEDFFEGKLNLKVNRSFIHYNPFPRIPDIDIDSILQKFDQINWERHIYTLRQKLRYDARFIEKYQTPDGRTDEEIFQITKDSLKAFIEAVKGRLILEGEPVDYDKLHNYLKLIAKHLEGEANETTQTDIIFRLAVEGGEYCGPGKFEVAESVFQERIGENKDVSFSDKILYCLQNMRNLWMQRLYSEAMVQGVIGHTVGRFKDYQDVHNYNLFLNLYGDEFGLRKAGAENDEAAFIDPLFKWVVLKALNKRLHQRFWNDYSPRHLRKGLIESIGTPQIPKPEVYDFWLKWIDRQEIEESEKEELRDELSLGKLFGEELEDSEGKIKWEFISLMLLDMGILEIEPEGHTRVKIGPGSWPSNRLTRP